MLRLIFFLTLLSATASAQMKLTIDQLKSFISSSKQMKHDDKKVAEFLRKVKMTEKLDNSVIDELLANGAGPKTVDVLRDLRDASKDLQAPRPALADPIERQWCGQHQRCVDRQKFGAAHGAIA